MTQAWMFGKRRNELYEAENSAMVLLRILKRDSAWYGNASHVEGAVDPHLVEQARAVLRGIHTAIDDLEMREIKYLDEQKAIREANDE